MSCKTLGVILSRLASTRLPEKAMADIAAKPLLGHIIDRMTCSHLIDHLVVATTLNVEDNLIADLSLSMKVDVYRGESSDVVARVVGAMKKYEAETVVVATGDNPFISP